MSDWPSSPSPPPGEYPPPPSGGAFAQGFPPSTPGPASGQEAKFFSRLFALIIDAFIVGVPAAVLVTTVAIAAPSDTGSCMIAGRATQCEQLSDSGLWVVMAAIATAFFFVAAYHGILIGRRGATVGHRALGIRVIDAHTGDLIGMPRAVARLLLHYVSGMFCYVGYFWMLWDSRSQTWHDKMTNSLVVRS